MCTCSIKTCAKNEDDVVDLSTTNINYMIVNYGDSSVKQVQIWVTECGFPKGGSFSVRQIILLREKLDGGGGRGQRQIDPDECFYCGKKDRNVRRKRKQTDIRRELRRGRNKHL